MTLLAWASWRILQRGQGRAKGIWFVLAVTLSATIFGLAHLPAVIGMGVEVTAPFVLYITSVNFNPGLLFGLSDAPSFLKAVQASRNELLYWAHWCHENYGAENAKSCMRFCQAAWQSRIEFPLGIFDVTTGDVIGATGVDHIKTTYKIGNVGYWVSTPFTGRGVAVAAAQRALTNEWTSSSSCSNWRLGLQSMAATPR